VSTGCGLRRKAGGSDSLPLPHKIKGRGRGRPRHTIAAACSSPLELVRAIHRANSTATAADRACPERSRRECPPHTRLTACFSGVIVQRSPGLFCSGGFLRCLLFLDAIHKFLRFTVFVRLAIFLLLFHGNSLQASSCPVAGQNTVQS